MKIKEKPVQKTFKMVQSKNNKLKTIKKSKFKPTKPKKKINLKRINVKEFTEGTSKEIGDEISAEVDSDMESESVSSKTLKLKTKKVTRLKDKKLNKGTNDVKSKMKKKKMKKVSAPSEDEEENDGSEGDNEAENNESDDSEVEFNDNMVKKHKEELHGLKTKDPEFYNYLKEHDKDLLNFDESSSDDEKEDLEVCHTAPQTLEVASDESDFEPEDGIPIERSDRSITMAMIKNWQMKLRNTKSKKLLKDVIDAFHAAVLRVSGQDDGLFRFKIDGAAIFNAVIRMSVMDLYPGLRSFLNMPEGSRSSPSQSKNWSKIRGPLKTYFSDLSKLAGVTSPSMLTVLLKHIHQMVPFLIYFPKIGVQTLKRAIDLWSKSEDVVRVLSFLCALRITNRSRSLLTSTLKRMYLTYARNTKFVSPNTLPEINFMRQSLAEMFALDDTVSYQLAFVFIRQLAIHLRNALTLKKKEHFQAVYSWRYVSSLQLWADVFCLAPDGSPLRSLVYPLVQIVIGTIKLIPSSQYYPLRFHCCQILISMSSKCDVFIPVLPFLLEVLREFDFNREHKKLSMKPMDLTCLLRCSKLQMKENAFKDALIENVNRLLVEYIATECHRISFPDVFVPAVLQLKQFAKDCKVANYTKLMKALADKIIENSKFIEGERKKLNFKLNDFKGVEAIEVGIKAKGTPFSNYYSGWKKIYVQQQAKKVVDNLKIGDFKLPVIYKLDKKRSREQSRSSGPPELFPSDDEASNISFGVEDESESESVQVKRVKSEAKKGDKGKDDNKKNKNKKVNGKSSSAAKKVKKQKRMVEPAEEKDDVVEDLDLSDF